MELTAFRKGHSNLPIDTYMKTNKKSTLKETTRQDLLRAIGWRKSLKIDGKAVVVYVPRAVCAVAGHPGRGATLQEAVALCATNFRAKDDQIVADWPQFPFAVESYLDREFAAKGFNFRPEAWFLAAAAAGKAGKLVQPSIPDRTEYHPTSVLVNAGLAAW